MNARDEIEEVLAAARAPVDDSGAATSQVDFWHVGSPPRWSGQARYLRYRDSDEWASVVVQGARSQSGAAVALLAALKAMTGARE